MPSSRHSTRRSPGATTSTARAAPPWAAAATADADDPVPEDVVGPTPRSRNHHSHAIWRFHVNELDVGASGKHRMRGKRRSEAVESLGIGKRAEHDALGIPDFKHRRRDRLASNIDTWPVEGSSAAPSRRERYSAPRHEPAARAVSRRHRCGACQSRIRSKILVARHERRQTSQPVSRELRPAAIRIQQLHRRTTIAEAIQEQAVGTNPMVPMTHGASERGHIATSLSSAGAHRKSFP